MRRRLVLILLALAFPALANASPRFLPQPDPEPLAVFVRDAATIHVLKVDSVDDKGISFKTAAALKGKAEEAPFQFVGLRRDDGHKALFQTGASVLCFQREDYAMLHIGSSWALAVRPDTFRNEKTWFCRAQIGFGVTYEGETDALQKHVAVILAGRETTILARTPRPGRADGGRLWRIKAGPEVTTFLLADESQHFVGWGTGDPDEVPKLTNALRAGAAWQRIIAAADLADLGSAARPALPALRRLLSDADPAIVLAAATALARLDADDDRGIETIRSQLRHPEDTVRAAAISALADLGPRACGTVPVLLRSLQDEKGYVRAATAEALSVLAPCSPSPREAVLALTASLKTEQNEDVQRSIILALRPFGPHAWPGLSALRESQWGSGDGSSQTRPQIEAVKLLTRFDPPPVELLTEVLANKKALAEARAEAADQLGALGWRARYALPTLHRVLQEPLSEDFSNRERLPLGAVEALLDIDQRNGPKLAVPVLTTLPETIAGAWRMELLVRCGRPARPAVQGFIAALEPGDPWMCSKVRDLTPLLVPEDRDSLPTLRKLLSGERSDPLLLAEVLLRLGNREEALTLAARGVEDETPYRRIAAARWLGQRGQEASSAEPALQRALAKASGAEKTWMTLTLWRVRGAEGTAPQARAFTALTDLLALCEGDQPAVSRLRIYDVLSSPRGYLGDSENRNVAAAIAVLHAQVQASGGSAEALSQALRDQRPHVRLVAAVALARVDPRHPDTVPALQKLLERYPHFFFYAADTLAALGPTAAPLAPEIVKLVRHSRDDVANAAGRVLRRIDPKLAARCWSAADVPGAVPEDLGPLWEDLAVADALRGDLAIWRLAAAGPRTVTLLRERLHSPTTLDARRAAGLIADLDSADFATRERASADLAETIECAAPALRRARDANPSLEVRRRIDDLLEGLEKVSSPAQRRRLRAVRLLAEMASPDSRALLKDLAAGDPCFALTTEAAAASRYLDRP